jgi:HEAT repeat protein
VFGKLPDARASVVKEVLLRAFRRIGEDQDVLVAALNAMAPWEDEQVRQAIRETYESTDPQMKAGAVCAMGVNLDPGWERFIVTELSSGYPEVRYQAALSAGELELTSAASDLIELTKDADSDVRLAAVSALGQIGGGEARRTLQRLAAGDDAALRDAAEESLERLQFGEDPLATSGRGLDVQALSRGKTQAKEQ